MSKSIKWRWPTPVLARFIAIFEPRPPSPAIATLADLTFSNTWGVFLAHIKRSNSSLEGILPFLIKNISSFSLIVTSSEVWNPFIIVTKFSLFE